MGKNVGAREAVGGGMERILIRSTKLEQIRSGPSYKSRGSYRGCETIDFIANKCFWESGRLPVRVCWKLDAIDRRR